MSTKIEKNKFLNSVDIFTYYMSLCGKVNKNRKTFKTDKMFPAIQQRRQLQRTCARANLIDQSVPLQCHPRYCQIPPLCDHDICKQINQVRSVKTGVSVVLFDSHTHKFTFGISGIGQSYSKACVCSGHPNREDRCFIDTAIREIREEFKLDVRSTIETQIMCVMSVQNALVVLVDIFGSDFQNMYDMVQQSYRRVIEHFKLATIVACKNLRYSPNETPLDTQIASEGELSRIFNVQLSTIMCHHCMFYNRFRPFCPSQIRATARFLYHLPQETGSFCVYRSSKK